MKLRIFYIYGAHSNVIYLSILRSNAKGYLQSDLQHSDNTEEYELTKSLPSDNLKQI